jgi:hypothetical protein
MNLALPNAQINPLANVHIHPGVSMIFIGALFQGDLQFRVGTSILWPGNSASQ